MELNKYEVDCLFHELQNLLKRTYYKNKTFPKSLEKILGHTPPKKSIPEDPSIYTLLKDHPRVREYLKEKDKTFSRPHLYSKILEAKKGDSETSIEFNDIYEELYFLPFEGHDNRDAFFQEYLYKGKKKADYSVFHFSRVTHKAESFDLEMQESFHDHIWVSLKKFHSSFPDVTLIGDIQRIGNCWRISTKYVKENLYLEIIIHTGESNATDAAHLLKLPFLRGILYGVSSAHYPVSQECILIRTDISDFADTEKAVKRYLNMERNNFNVKIEGADIDKIDHLKAGNYHPHLISHIARTWRILTYNDLTVESFKTDQSDAEPERKPTILQSVFVIEEDFTGTITVPIPGAKPEEAKDITMTCYLSVNNYDSPRLVVKVLAKDDFSLSIFTILEIPTAGKKDRVIRGAFCNTGFHTNKPIGGLFVMTEDEPGLTVKVDKKEDLDKEKPEKERRDALMELYRINKLRIPAAWK